MRFKHRDLEMRIFTHVEARTYYSVETRNYAFRQPELDRVAGSRPLNDTIEAPTNTLLNSAYNYYKCPHSADPRAPRDSENVSMCLAQ